jgi:hypothetical protein
MLRRKRDFAPGLRRVGVVVQNEGAGVKVNDEVGATFGEAVEEAKGGFVPGIEEVGAGGEKKCAVSRCACRASMSR